jgi:hypothetical protein
MSPSLVPQLNQEIHFVLCKFGSGQADVETDPMEANRASIPPDQRLQICSDLRPASQRPVVN